MAKVVRESARTKPKARRPKPGMANNIRADARPRKIRFPALDRLKSRPPSAMSDDDGPEREAIEEIEVPVEYVHRLILCQIRYFATFA